MGDEALLLATDGSNPFLETAIITVYRERVILASCNRAYDTVERTYMPSSTPAFEFPQDICMCNEYSTNEMLIVTATHLANFMTVMY